MRTQFKLWWILGGFFVFAAGVYVLWFYLDNPGEFQWFGGPHSEGFWVGFVAITLTGVFAGFVAFFIQRVFNRQGGELPEDTDDADIDDGDPNIGHFAPYSWWPFALVASLAFVFVGLGVGVWLSFYGVPLVLISLTGWVYEHYRGNFAH